MSNWEKQIEEHCVRGALSSCVYYGATRSMSPQELMKYDVVITTYQVYCFLRLLGLRWLDWLAIRLSLANTPTQDIQKIKVMGQAKRRRKSTRACSMCSGRYILTPTYLIRFPFNLGSQRIILDEGHSIRNSRTKMAKAVCALSAQRRWVLSGTPIVRQQQFDIMNSDWSNI
jgi:SWI/SNF-related matrix-associated actin-dependent regulator of chromatin subfamily A3